MDDNVIRKRVHLCCKQVVKVVTRLIVIFVAILILDAPTLDNFFKLLFQIYIMQRPMMILSSIMVIALCMSDAAPARHFAAWTFHSNVSQSIQTEGIMLFTEYTA